MTLPLCVRISATDQRSADALRKDGWREIEVLETYEWTYSGGGLPDWPPELCVPGLLEQVRIYSEEKFDALWGWIERIAVEKFKYDRLHVDPLVPKADADQFKRDWVRTARGASDNQTTVLMLNGKEPVAFCIMKRIECDSNGWNCTWAVDLIASAVEGHKFGKAVLAGAIGSVIPGRASFQPVPITKFIAGTQESNEPGRALYASLGFSVVNRQRTFHKIVNVT